MEIDLGNKILNIQFRIFKTPNKKRLKKELLEYFSKNDVNGKKIEDFSFDPSFTNAIVPEKPHFEGCLLGGKYEKDLKEIGNKYGIENLGFIYWCYGK